jgi:hypothetical protein
MGEITTISGEKIRAEIGDRRRFQDKWGTCTRLQGAEKGVLTRGERFPTGCYRHADETPSLESRAPRGSQVVIMRISAVAPRVCESGEEKCRRKELANA